MDEAAKDPTSPPRSGILTFRMAALVILAVSLNLFPVYHQILGGEGQVGFAWRMFSGVGDDIYTLAYTLTDRRGGSEPFDHRSLGGPAAKPVRSQEELDKVTQAVCAHAGRGKTVRLTAQRASPEGWQTVETVGGDVCRGLRAPGNSKAQAAGAGSEARQKQGPRERPKERGERPDKADREQRKAEKELRRQRGERPDRAEREQRKAERAAEREARP